MSGRRRPEQQLQRAVVDCLTWCAKPNAFFFHVPNGGWRSPAEARIFKALGVIAGVPDLIIIYAGRCYALELKAEGGGRLTDVQRVCHEALRAAGAEVSVARGVDAAIAQLMEWRLLRNVSTQTVQQASRQMMSQRRAARNSPPQEKDF